MGKNMDFIGPYKYIIKLIGGTFKSPPNKHPGYNHMASRDNVCLAMCSKKDENRPHKMSP